MSRRRSAPSTKASVSDRDVVMGPPPPPASTAATQQTNQEINEKYRNLKRRFFELEEKHKETSTELQRSGERNVKMREERNILLDRIIELESQYSFKSNGRSSLSPPLSSALAQPGSSALPRTLLGARARASFVANLREAVNDPDDDTDPILTSRHVGPEARRRYEGESRERFDEELHEPRRSGRNTRSSLVQAGGSSNKGKESSTNEGDSPHHNASGSRSTPPVASTSSPSRGHSNYSSTQSHPHSRIHPPPLSPPRQQHHPTPRHHLLTSEQDGYHPRSRSPGSGDDMASGIPLPSDSRPISGEDTTGTQDNSFNDRHHTNGNVAHDETTISPNHGENTDAEAPGPDLAGPSSAPRRDSARTRRGVRNDHAATPADDGRDQPEPTRRTRSSAKRGSAAAPPTVRTRATRRGNAAAAEAKAKAAERRESENSSHHQPTPIPPSSGVPLPAPEQQDVEMHDPPPVVETAQKQGVTPTTPVEPASSHPPYLDPALVSQSTRQTAVQRSNSSTPSTSTAEAGKPSEPSIAQPSPMENIVRVAEAAVAAQNALKQNNPSPAAAAPPQPTVQTTNGSQNGNSGTSPTSATTPSSATHNPYMMLSAAATKPNGNGVAPGTSPSGMPIPPHPLAIGMNPYAIYYPPGMPMSPSATHPYANPYYYMAPMPGPNGMYSTNPSFAPLGSQRPSSEAPHQPKPKRLKAHTVTSKNFSIPMVPRDKSGKPMLPLNVGIMTVIKLGDVCMREHFHTERYIFPVGYEVSRRYLSTVDPNIEVVYHCTILDGGDGPKFQIIPSDVPDRPVIAGTATGAWSSIVKQANAIRNRQHSNSVSGPDFFGLGQNTIKHLIQELPNADRLRDYVWQRFVEGGPLGGRHAAVIPALPEEFDASHSVGALHYDKQKVASAVVATSSPKGIYHYPQHIQQQAIQQQAQQQIQQQQQQQASSSQGPQPARTGSYYPDHQNHYPDHQSSGRTIRNPASCANGDSPSGSARSTRASTRSQVQQPQPSDGSTESGSPNAMPSTIATLLNAYPSSGPGPHE